jgi:hypothetical protein
MLFDLRGRGRRRTVRVIYIGLALLFGVGFVGFGVGVGGGGGGIFNSLTNNEGSGGTTFAGEIKKYRKLTEQQPNNTSDWEHLLSAQLHEAGNEAYVSRTGQLTSKGKELFSQVARTWNSYLALNPPKPSPELAQRMVTVFGEEGLNEPAAAVQVLQIIVAAHPTNFSYYAALAQYAYKANNTRVGDLAAQKAIHLAPAIDQPRLKTELSALKKKPTESSTSTGTGTTASTTGVLPIGTATSTSTPSGSLSTKKK